MCCCLGEDNCMSLVLCGHFCILGVVFLSCLNGPFLGDIGSVYLCGNCLSPSACKLPENGLKCPRGPFDCALSPVDLRLEVVQPGIPKDNAWVPKVGDIECLDFVPLSLVNTQLYMLLNDSSFVFHPIHIVDLLGVWEECCLDFECLCKLPVNKVFSSSAVH
jgi:hypothetical protein